jgi:elongation factor G
MKREFKVEANVGAPQVAYRETITQGGSPTAQASRGGSGQVQYGHVVLEIEPQERGKGYEFINETRRRVGSEGIRAGR